MLFSIFFFHLIFNSGCFTKAARILAIFPYPSHSQQVVSNELCLALQERGHELVVFTTDPVNRNLANYSEVSLKSMYKEHARILNFYAVSKIGFWRFAELFLELGRIITDYTYSTPEMKKIILEKKNQRFDVILVSAMYWDSLYYLADVLDVPMIGVSSLPTQAIHNYIMGNPYLTACFPEMLSGFTDQMSFKERIINLFWTVKQMYYYKYKNLPIQSRVLKKHFGDAAPPVDELINRLSMIFTNSRLFFNFPRTSVPGILQIGGLRHIKAEKTLPPDLKKILDNAERGFIYFSLGSNVKSTQLDGKILNSFIEAFSELPYQIVWKFEADKLAQKPDNVHIRPWMPQYEILAHPNLKLFIYQGGLQSTEEAIENSVPVLGFPVISDQMHNMKILVLKGAGKMLEIHKVDANIIKNAINEIISDPCYKKNMIKLRKLLHDRPLHPMNESIWWIEHIIRHKGGAHLRTRSRDLPWYKVELLDIFLFFFILLVALAVLSWTLVRSAIGLIKARIFPFIKTSRNNWTTMAKCKAS
ncbi:UDP-glucuronosyltransferase 2B9-like [Chelonus insularis]|uniref:UDP-glucuronosyltransferase 2B9-like n=1 Tax=Chelonus insularis TaxID=460826 RepID=UPI00158EB88E|nr:UDP-glucuronosyltransferase 2B9-like [Chelonus insularis]